MDLQGKAVDLEGRLRDKELEVEQLRKALSQAGVKQEVVASPDDHVSAPHTEGSAGLCCSQLLLVYVLHIIALTMCLQLLQGQDRVQKIPVAPVIQLFHHLWI